MGTNENINFYILKLNIDKMRDYCCTTYTKDSEYCDIPFLACKKENSKDDVMIDLLTGIEIYPKANHPLPALTYYEKRIATLNEISKVSAAISFYKNGDQKPYNMYKKMLVEELEKARRIFDEYCKYYDNITDYIYELRPIL